MIRPELAQRFIDRITKYTEYNINIMDENGVIIASRSANRIGTYHEAADRIIRGKEEILVIEDDRTYPGVLPGINMAIMVNGRKEGVVGVTGDPAHIREVAMVTRLAIEAMLKYEKQQEQILLRQGRMERFFQLLVYSPGIDPAELRAAARTLEYDESLIRVPILCAIHDDTPSERVLEAILADSGSNPQDLSAVLDDTHVLVFRVLREKKGGKYLRFRESILSGLDDTLRRLDRTGVRAVFYVGTPQNSFSQYIYACRHCRWMESADETRKKHSDITETGADRVRFFYDNVADYFYSVLPKEELHRVFYQYRLQIRGEERDQFLDVVGALIDNGFNLTEAAKALYIHKNTMMYRYNKIKDMFDIDPIRKTSDRTFLTLLYHSLL